ncbi:MULTISPECIES: NAD(+) synthase [Pontibacillus]|uniref:NH(3)-dependent NAD(+) synthetase n=1 Tax=Pontibacillus chungwhensis TaxID=265426 RepID=A0ABY8V0C8_9BACI|nr:NAD(+) synthase [Pontibacillus chungwhensis]MCD5325080.1 NAD(+) synthase [Pontibacillus sp. HN14]WIF97331.1 NAD(+) synthase [Pontibacillus chungwhensis]
MEKKVEYLTHWIQEKVEEAGAKGALVGISGGIDSAVVSCLVKRAFPEQSLGVILPIDQEVEDQEDAVTLVEQIGLNYIGINLTDPYQTTHATIREKLKEKGDWQEDRSQLGGANLQARLRMSTLYAVAHHYGYLVVGTDNAAEDYTGYFTKYGDGGVDLVPLIHLRKEEVRELAEYLEVPESIVHKKPSAELWEGQSDEDELGVSYDTIDAYLRGETVSDKDAKRIEELHKQTEHKRQIPAGPEPYKGE